MCLYTKDEMAKNPSVFTDLFYIGNVEHTCSTSNSKTQGGTLFNHMLLVPLKKYEDDIKLIN